MRRFLVLVVALCAVAIGAPAAHACSCLPKPALREAVGGAQVAFSGTVVRLLDGDRYEVRVDGVLTGNVPETVILQGEPRSSTCRLELAKGPVVYAGSDGYGFGNCSGVWQGTEATQALASSGLVRGAPTPGTAPPQPDDGRVPPWLVAAAVAAILGTAAAVTLRRRRNAAASAGGTASAG